MDIATGTARITITWDTPHRYLQQTFTADVAEDVVTRLTYTNIKCDTRAVVKGHPRPFDHATPGFRCLEDCPINGWVFDGDFTRQDGFYNNARITVEHTWH